MSSNGAGSGVRDYKRIGGYSADTIAPDAPEGGWQVTALVGKTKVKPTSSGGDPMVTFQFRLAEADDDRNEAYIGVNLFTRVIFYDDADTTVKARAKSMNKTRLQDLCRAAQVDLSIIPTDEESWKDPETALQPFIDAIEGKLIQGYTTHKKNKDNPGLVDVELGFRKPGSFTTPGKTRNSDD